MAYVLFHFRLCYESELPLEELLQYSSREDNDLRVHLVEDNRSEPVTDVEFEGVPVLFPGDAEEWMEIIDERGILHVDLLRSSFYLLNCEDERTITDRDAYGRVPFEKTILGKHGWVLRPLVNEYFDLIALFLNYKQVNSSL